MSCLFHGSQIKNLVIEAEKEVDLHIEDIFQHTTIDNLILKNVTLSSENELITNYFDNCNINKLAIRGNVNIEKFMHVMHDSLRYGENISIKQVDLGSYEELIQVRNSKEYIDDLIVILDRLKAKVVIRHG